MYGSYNVLVISQGCTNTIEGVWSQIKRKLKAMNGTLKSKLPSYLDEYNWRKCYPGDPFDNLLADI